jgi:hypothetical protein
MHGSVNVKQERYLNKHAYAWAIISKPRDTGLQSMLKSLSNTSQKNTVLHKYKKRTHQHNRYEQNELEVYKM